MDADDLLAKVAEQFKDEKINTLDGVKIDFDEGWVHFRKSNTEPIVRVYSEGKSEADARSLADKVLDVIK
jgi:phosphomannomutase